MIDLKKVREIVNEHVRIAVGEIEEKEPQIIFAVRDKLAGETREVWRVNVTYTPKTKSGVSTWKRFALFKIDAETGEVLEFKEGWIWSS
jgi:hypothetical protein